MKYFLKTSVIISLVLGLIPFIHSCKKGNVPTLTTATLTNITLTMANSGGAISNEGSDIIIARGVCWSTGIKPTIADNKTIDGTGIGSFTSNITNLSPNTKYYVRAYATNSIGTGYGNLLILKTYTGTVSDIDGNVYYTVKIDQKIWMAENLKVTHFNDGSPISNVNDDALWANSSSPEYCWYNNDSVTYKATYGALYNYYAIEKANLCPEGWYTASYPDWETLIAYLGGQSVAGGKLKEAGLINWQSPNTGATNESGFTGLPGGYRDRYGYFSLIGIAGYWWCVGDAGLYDAYYKTVDMGFERWIASGSSLGNYGVSVRCTYYGQ
ncbi:MAG: fibrobacter succinogenes major paralogous domain-containing protein [Bacteroidales bacterium]